MWKTEFELENCNHFHRRAWGNRKTFLINLILSFIRKEHGIATASSGIPATLFKLGRTSRTFLPQAVYSYPFWMILLCEPQRHNQSFGRRCQDDCVGQGPYGASLPLWRARYICKRYHGLWWVIWLINYFF